jgi:hypothetical protein
MSEEVEFLRTVAAMRRRFVVPPPPDQVFSRVDPLVDELDPEHQPLGQIFRHNLNSVLSSVSIPFALASASAHDRHFQRIHSAEGIRALPIDSVIGLDTTEPDPEIEEAREREVYEKAMEQMAEFQQSEEGRNAIILDISNFLLRSLKSEDLELAANEIIRQGIILIWSAFEILFRDTFEQELNLDPSKARLLVEDVSTRKRFEADKFSLETLIQHRFDLSNKLGTILVGQQDFSNLPAIRAVYSVLFGSSAELMRRLNQDDLWLLYQRRHLCVHRRGIVDQAYINNTNDDLPLGSPLVIIPQRFEEHFNVVLETGEALLQSLPSKTAT